MNTHMWRKMTLCSAVAVAAGLWTSRANAAGFLWISAPNWSYSAAAAETPIGWAYFWGLSVDPGSYSWAYAYSPDPPVGAAYAYAEARAGYGGMGGVEVAGIADPYAGVGIDISLTDPSNPTGYPSSKPSDPFSSSYNVSESGITFTGSGEELSALDGVEAFLYTGGTDESSLDTELGAPSDSESGSALGGDLSDISMLESEFGSDLEPLGPMITDPGSLSGLTFTENLSDLTTDGLGDVILVGEGEAAVPEPASLSLLALGGLALLRRRRKA